MPNLPDIAVINFSDQDNAFVQEVIRAVNRQVTEDFLPIWGSGYICKLHASAFDPAVPSVIQADPVPAEAVVYLVNEANIAGALGYHDLNNSEVPVGFVFTELGEWTITFSHEVLELIVDPTVNILVPGPDPRSPGDPNAWLLHTYEVCDAVERSSYLIDQIAVSDFVTPQYFAEGNAAGTRNDFLGVGVDSFGVTAGSHLGTVDPFTWQWVTILAADAPNGSANIARTEQFSVRPLRDNSTEEYGEQLQSALSLFKEKPPEGCTGLPGLHAITRTNRYQAAAQRMRDRQE